MFNELNMDVSSRSFSEQEKVCRIRKIILGLIGILLVSNTTKEIEYVSSDIISITMKSIYRLRTFFLPLLTYLSAYGLV